MKRKEGWTQWNVSLWINNDEGLYNCARNYRRFSRYKTARDAAKAMLSDLHQHGITKTPDGAVYSVTNIAKAISDI